MRSDWNDAVRFEHICARRKREVDRALRARLQACPSAGRARSARPTFSTASIRGEWNRFVITMRGDRVSVVLNDVPIVDDARGGGVPAEGPITLQNHNDLVAFRNFGIKRLAD